MRSFVKLDAGAARGGVKLSCFDVSFGAAGAERELQTVRSEHGAIGQE